MATLPVDAKLKSSHSRKERAKTVELRWQLAGRRFGGIFDMQLQVVGNAIGHVRNASLGLALSVRTAKPVAWRSTKFPDR